VNSIWRWALAHRMIDNERNLEYLVVRRKLVITLTTVHGSRQITLSQLARYSVLALLLVAGCSFALSNYLLVRATDTLEVLEMEHIALSTDYEQLNQTLESVTEQRDSLESRYQEALGSQQTYLTELNQLSTRLTSLADERESLTSQIERVAAERETLEAKMQRLALEREQSSEQLSSQMEELNQLAQERSELASQNEELVQAIEELGYTLGLEAKLEGLDADARVALIESTARERQLLLNMIPNGSPAQFTRVNSDFGQRVHPVTKKRSMHRGVDLKMVKGTPVYATADGIVEAAGTDTKGGFGKIIRIQHSFGFRTYYAHLNKLLVSPGEYVVKGQQIAESGNTGRSTGPHLHYEVRQLWTALDPAPFMSWSLENYDQLFTQVEEVNWGSLGKQYPLRTATTVSR